MRSTAKNTSASRRLTVEWREQADARPVAVELSPARLPDDVIARRSVEVRKRGYLSARRCGQAGAFTLLELMLVVAIIGFLAAVTLPHVAGYNRANTLTSATRQLLDDVARARSRALANRSTVYMVFVPSYWDVVSKVEKQVQQPSPQLTNLLGHQFASYALLSARTVGDQPGQHYPHYLTEWQTLPSGMYFWPGQFSSGPFPFTPLFVRTLNSLNGTLNLDINNGIPTNSFPFPSVSSGTWMNLPYIAFSPDGTLLGRQDAYIMLSRGSILYPADSNGVYQASPPNLVETPPGNPTNNPCMIKIDWVTSRGSIVQNQFQ